MSNHLTNLTLKIWRQTGPNDQGHFESYKVDSISDEASFLEMLDVLNERLIGEGEAQRDDENFAYVAAWQYPGEPLKEASVVKEQLEFHEVHLATRSYK